MAADPGTIWHDPGKFEPVTQMRRLEPVDLDPFVTLKRTDPIPVRLRLPSNPAIGLDEELVKLRLPANPNEEFNDDPFDFRTGAGTGLETGDASQEQQPIKDEEFFDDRPAKQPTKARIGDHVARSEQPKKLTTNVDHKRESKEKRPQSVVSSTKTENDVKEKKQNKPGSRRSTESESEQKDRGRPDPIIQQAANRDFRDKSKMDRPLRRASPLAARSPANSVPRRVGSAHGSRDGGNSADWLSNGESEGLVWKPNLIRELRLQRQREKERREECKKAQQIINYLHGQTDRDKQPDRDTNRQREPDRYTQQNKQRDGFIPVEHGGKNTPDKKPTRESSRSRNPRRGKIPQSSENLRRREKPRPASESGYEHRQFQRAGQSRSPNVGSPAVNQSKGRDRKAEYACRPASAQAMSRLISGLPPEERRRLRAALEEELRLYKI